MNSRLPRLPALIVVAAAALIAMRDRSGAAPAVTQYSSDRTASQPLPPAEVEEQSKDSPSLGDKLLMQAATMLERRVSVSARLRHQVFIGDNPLYGVGSYWQQGSGAELRVRLELQIAGQEASLLQISDSWFLWIDRRLPTGRSVLRVNLRKLRAEPVVGAANFADIEPGNAAWSTVQPELLAHSGGLPSLLAALSENFSFLPPQAMRLAAQSPAESQAGSVPVFAVVGHWKQERLSALLSRNRGSSVESRELQSLNSRLSTLNSIPSRLPQEVLLIVGQADLFPYRIEYRRLETPLASGDAPPIPYQLSANPLVVLELTDVAFDVPIAAGQFDYDPGDADWVDQTAMVLEQLRRERQEQIAVRDGSNKGSLPVR